jgi:hypothetical protein
MDAIPLFPLLCVITMTLVYRYVVRRRPLGIRGWVVSSLLVAFLSLSLPLGWGIWLPDIFGTTHTLGSATTSSGHRISIVQYWNHQDFYTTEMRVTGPDGVTVTSVLDGDASKRWSATLELDPSQKSATLTYPDGLTGKLTW